METDRERVLPSKTSALKALMEDSRRIRNDRGEDLFESKKEVRVEPAATAPTPEAKTNFREIRDAHLALKNIVLEFDREQLKKHEKPELKDAGRAQVKCIHVYLKPEIYRYLKDQRANPIYALRRNAGVGSIISRFIDIFRETRKREEYQLNQIVSIANDFRVDLVDFKKLAQDPEQYKQTEEVNQRILKKSREIHILLPVLGFDEKYLKKNLKEEDYKFIDLLWKWQLIKRTR